MGQAALNRIDQRPAPVLAAIVLVALVARIAVVLATPDYAPVFDSGDYHRHAVSIASGDGFPDSVFAAGGGPSAFRPPVYPYFLGGVYAIAGDRPDAGRLAGCVFGALLVLLLYAIGSRGWNRRVGLAAAALAAVFPPLVFLHAALIGEPLFLALVLASIAAVLEYRRSQSTRWLVAAGVACGLAVLTRSNGLLLLAVLLLGVIWPARPRLARPSLAATAVLVAATLLTIAPWSLRNTFEFDRFVPLNTQSGFALAGQYNQEARDFPDYPASWVLPQRTERYRALYERRDLDEAELDTELRQRARSYALDHPGHVLESTAVNSLRSLEVLETAPVADNADLLQRGLGETAALLDRLSFYLFSAAALLGLWLLVRRPRESRGPMFLWLVPLLLWIAAVPIIGSPRYRVPLEPFVVLLSGIAAVELARARRLRRTEPRAPSRAR